MTESSRSAFGAENRSSPSSSAGGEAKFLNSKVVSTQKEAKKQKKQIILLTVLVPFFFYLFYSNVIKPMQKVTPGPTSQSNANTESRANRLSSEVRSPQSFSFERPSEDTEANEWGRSPFSMSPVQDEQEGGFKLEGIVFDNYEAYAVINKNIVRENDQIADKVVLEIRESEVTLQSSEGEISVLKI